MADLSPHQRLRFFLDRIGMDEGEAEILERFAPLFVARKRAFADYFCDIFYDIADTRPFLEEEGSSGRMKKVWAGWFEAFFGSKADDEFLAYLWAVGARHVEVSLDQRFSNLGFAMIRQFCHNVASREVPSEKRDLLLSAINKKLDLCLLAETTAYIETTVSCDIEVMREVADRVRNPALVIGWNIKKLQSKVEEGTREYSVYQMLMGENLRLEHMVGDIKVYMDIFQGEPEFQPVEIRKIVAPVLENADTKEKLGHIRVDVDFQDGAHRVQGDEKWLGYLFHYLIQNSVEAVGEEEGFVRISSRLEDTPPFNVRIEIFNSGASPTEEAEKLFTPFFSTKPTGTGFGLPIARLVARKLHGSLSIQGEPGNGTRVIVSLPNPARGGYRARP